MLIAGIDEAGRGPALGPMVLAIAVINKKDEEKLKEINVKDSKELTVSQRTSIYTKLKDILLEFYSIKIFPKELDELMNRKSLNEIEAMKAALLVEKLKSKPDLLIIDCPDTMPEKFSQRIKKYLSMNITIKSEHKADKNHLIVSAASIIAKVERDREIEKLKRLYGDIGSGYSHDPKTIKFIKNYLEKNEELPEFARKQWQTNQTILNNKLQKKLLDW